MGDIDLTKLGRDLQDIDSQRIERDTIFRQIEEGTKTRDELAKQVSSITGHVATLNAQAEAASREFDRANKAKLEHLTARSSALDARENTLATKEREQTATVASLAKAKTDNEAKVKAINEREGNTVKRESDATVRHQQLNDREKQVTQLADARKIELDRRENAIKLREDATLAKERSFEGREADVKKANQAVTDNRSALQREIDAFNQEKGKLANDRDDLRKQKIDIDTKAKDIVTQKTALDTQAKQVADRISTAEKMEKALKDREEAVSVKEMEVQLADRRLSVKEKKAALQDAINA